jgi:hypothetical protein
MLVRVRHMVIRFPISAGISRSALLLGVDTRIESGWNLAAVEHLVALSPVLCRIKQVHQHAGLTRGQWRAIMYSALQNQRDDSPTITPFGPWMAKSWPI